MDTKTLIAGLIGFFLGGLLVATVATMNGYSDSSSHGPATSQAQHIAN